MKKIVVLSAVLILVLSSCKKAIDQTVVEAVPTEINYEVFGDSIKETPVLTQVEMSEKYKNMKAGDTLAVQFKSKIEEVCQKKGCWMSLSLDEGQKSFVKFKDYSFFVPMNAGDHEVIVSGKAYVNVVSVDELKHYAKDGGKTEAEIAAITEPKITYSFMADGVQINK
ncbi:DUF4920 domain-containing protein [Flavobacterium sp. NKUCC04_CG]|uniref:DUF4920 domain-containing protein n=1 Tax=Flavobacterium sp. NKUCC04_CG TaxID=2842121 RepID=UPI001C5AE77D|nr:DUF4920 domain-containing protein [Flavobacterium sp. NKUCC04_CG]MBW3518731.1 DUF4920 domain-containing protein [Flavobacterium sp. NKUCC04_CG]